jgi:hypothetical protein
MLRSAIVIVIRVVDATCVGEDYLIRNEDAVTKLPYSPIREYCPGTKGADPMTPKAPM